MDPYSMVKLLLRFWRWAVPVLVVVLLAVGYVALFGPRTYESSATFVIVSPNVPTDRQLETNSRLAKLNSNNPYLRSDDQSLIVKILIAKMSAQATQDQLKQAGLSTDYTFEQSALSQMTMIITTSAPTAQGSEDSRQALITIFEQELVALQKVNGADDTYLFTALPVDLSVTPTLKTSSLLRSVILVFAGGCVLLIGVVSLGVGLERRRSEQLARQPLPAQKAVPAATTGSTSAEPNADRRPRSRSTTAEPPRPRAVTLSPTSRTPPSAESVAAEQEPVKSTAQRARRPRPGTAVKEENDPVSSDWW